jgi:hypothetical protein
MSPVVYYADDDPSDEKATADDPRPGCERPVVTHRDPQANHCSQADSVEVKFQIFQAYSILHACPFDLT